MSPATARTAAGRIPGIHADAARLAALAGTGSRISLGDHNRSQAPRSGRLASRLRGRGMEFAETRIYSPGDDVRNMDWRVTARTGTPHTKIYEEERERPVMLLADFGPSMFFGTRVALKSVLAAEVATLLAWAAVGRGDRAGVITSGVAGLHETRPAGGRRGALACIRALVRDSRPPAADAPRREEASLADALLHARRVCRPGTLVFIVSDLNGLDEQAGRHLGRLRRHSDVIACRLFDAVETTPPPGSRIALSDGTERLLLDSAAGATRDAWAAHFDRIRTAALDRLRSQAVPVLEIATDDDVAARLRASLGGGVRGLNVRGSAHRAA